MSIDGRNKASRITRAGFCPFIDRFGICCALLVFMIGPTLRGPLASAQESELLKRRFLDEAPSRWQEVRAFERTLQGFFTETTRIVNLKTGKETRSENRFEIKLNSGSVLLHALKGDEGDAVVNASNPKYSFKLRYVDAKAAWLLWSINIKKPGEGVVSGDTAANDYVIQRVAIDAVFDEFLADWLKEKTFKVVAAKNIEQRERQLVEVSFEFARPKESKRADHVKGRFVFDPKLHWCIVEQELFQTQQMGPQRSLITKEYKEGRDGFPIVSREKLRATIEGVYQSDKDWEYDFHAAASPPGDEEFTLSAFGLPEPVGITWARGPRYYLWIGGAAFAALAVALGFRWLAKKRQPAASPFSAPAAPGTS